MRARHTESVYHHLSVHISLLRPAARAPHGPDSAPYHRRHLGWIMCLRTLTPTSSWGLWTESSVVPASTVPGYGASKWNHSQKRHGTL